VSLEKGQIILPGFKVRNQGQEHATFLPGANCQTIPDDLKINRQYPAPIGYKRRARNLPIL